MYHIDKRQYDLPTFPHTMTTYGYLRVSTDDQTLGLDAQRAQILRYAPNIEEWFTDHGVSGASEAHERPGLTAALARLRRGDTLVAAKRDRFARDPRVMGDIEGTVAVARAYLRTADGSSDSDTPEAQLLAGMLDVIARHERDLIRSRTKAALAALKVRGMRTGNTRFGWRQDAPGTRLVADLGEQTVLMLIPRLRAEGYGARRISRWLAREGFLTRSGTPFAPGNVQRLLAQASGRTSG